MKPQVLLLLTSSGLGGAEQVVLDFLTRSPDEMPRFHVVLPDQGPLVEQLDRRGITHTILPLGHHLKQWGQRQTLPLWTRLKALGDLGSYLRALHRLIKIRQPDVVYTHGIKAELVSTLLAPFIPCSIVWHLHVFAPRSRMLRFWYRLWTTFKKIHAMANSQAVGQSYQSWFNAPIPIAYAAIDPQRYHPMERGQALADLSLDHAIGPHDLVVGMVTILAPWKGCTLFLEALKILAPDYPNLRAIICGGSIYTTQGHQHYGEALQVMAREAPLQGRIFFVPFQTQVAPAYGAMDIVVHASLEPEPFGRVVSEARLCNRPIVASAGGGVLEQVIDGETGLLFPMGDADTLAKAIKKLLDDASFRQSLAIQGRQWVVEHLSLKKFQTTVDNYLDALVSSSRR